MVEGPEEITTEVSKDTKIKEKEAISKKEETVKNVGEKKDSKVEKLDQGKEKKERKPSKKGEAKKEDLTTKGQFYLKKVSQLDVSLAIRQMSLMLKSGLSIAEVLKAVSFQMTDMRLKIAFATVAEDVLNGKNVAKAMKKHPKIFKDLVVSVVSVGEQGGTLEKNLRFLTDYLKNEYLLNKKIKSALMYPAIVFSITVVEMFGMVFYILPSMEEMFKSFENIPAFTTFILGPSTFIRTNILAIVGILLVVALGIFLFFKTEIGKKFLDKFSLKFPVIKMITINSSLTSISRTFGILLESGIPIANAMKITSETIGNTVYATTLMDIYEEIKEGQNISTTLLEYPELFPHSFTQMIDVGESTGTLEENLSYLYDYHSNEVDDIANNLTTLIEPLLLVFIAGMIGMLAITIIGPIYQLTGSIN